MTAAQPTHANAIVDPTPEPPRILFVDDDQYLLEGLRDALRPYRRKWSMRFAHSGEEALAVLDDVTHDVVVTDLRMPVMDGATLLERVRDRSPSTVRIVLSGHAELRVVARAAGVAHQLLAKPCEAEQLAQVIERACAIRQAIARVELNRGAVTATHLPSVPHVYLRLTDMLNSGQPSPAEITAVVEQDVAITAKILQVANSAYFGRRNSVSQIEDAVIYLGTEALHALVLQAGAFSQFPLHSPVPGFDIEWLQRHCYRVGAVAKSILAEDANLARDAFTAGLLHDVGLLVLAAQDPASLSTILAAAVADQRPVFAIEHERCGVTHAEIGAYMLALWGLPVSVTAAVSEHHRCPRPEEPLDEALAVYLANILVEQAEADHGITTATPTELDPDILATRGLSDRLPRWQEAAAKAVG